MAAQAIFSSAGAEADQQKGLCMLLVVPVHHGMMIHKLRCCTYQPYQLLLGLPVTLSGCTQCSVTAASCVGPARDHCAGQDQRR